MSYRNSGAATARRGQQLCKAARHAINLALMCDCQDPLLESCRLVSVDQGLGTFRLQVLISVSDLSLDEIDEVRNRLSAMKGYLRSEIARSIRRKRVPDLSFVVIDDSMLN